MTDPTPAARAVPASMDVVNAVHTIIDSMNRQIRGITWEPGYERIDGAVRLLTSWIECAHEGALTPARPVPAGMVPLAVADLKIVCQYVDQLDAWDEDERVAILRVRAALAAAAERGEDS